RPTRQHINFRSTVGSTSLLDSHRSLSNSVATKPVFEKAKSYLTRLPVALQPHSWHAKEGCAQLGMSPILSSIESAEQSFLPATPLRILGASKALLQRASANRSPSACSVRDRRGFFENSSRKIPSNACSAHVKHSVLPA